MTDLPTRAFDKEDQGDDLSFYKPPRLVTHIDEGAVASLTACYRELVPANGRVLDLMSSWVSHLPDDVEYAEVIGHGMNAAELAANPRLTRSFVQDLNRDPALPLGDASVDAAAICVSIQYLQQPVAVLREVARVLRPDGVVAITFSNRCFPTKAVAIWHHLDDQGHLELVGRYLEEAGNWADIVQLDRSPKAARMGLGDPLYAVVARARPAA